jgi:hypothetical protein
MNGGQHLAIRVFALNVGILGASVSSLAQIPAGSTINFGTQTVRTVSEEILVTTVPSISGSTGTIRFAITGDFRPGPSSTCPTTPASTPSGGCDLTVVFAPTRAGVRNGQVIFESTACVPFGCPTQIWRLRGIGIAPPPPTPPPPTSPPLDRLRIGIRVTDVATGQPIGESVSSGTSFQVTVSTNGIDCAGQWVVTSIGAPGLPPSVIVQAVPFIVGPALGNDSAVGFILTTSPNNRYKVSASCNGFEVGEHDFAFFEFFSF